MQPEMRAQVWISSIAYVLVIGAAIGLLVWRESTEEPITDATIAETKLRGQTIADALERFHRAHDAYPAQLTELVPWYLTDVPRPAAGTKRWVYSMNFASFILAFGTRANKGEGLKPGWYFERGSWYARP